MTCHICDNELKTIGQLACHQLSDLLLHRSCTAHLVQITNYDKSHTDLLGRCFMNNWIRECYINESKGSIVWISVKRILPHGSSYLAITSYPTLSPTAHLTTHSEGSTSSQSLIRMWGSRICHQEASLLSQRRISHLAIPRALRAPISTLHYVTVK